MHYFIFADKDTTLYQASSSMNAGLDEVLEIRKDVSDTGATVEVSRILIRFDLTQVSQSIVDGDIPSDAKFYLRMFEAQGNSDLSADYKLAFQPISQSWSEGVGKFGDNPKTELTLVQCMLKEGIGDKHCSFS